ncbi:MAG: acetyl-CoA carboxylase biotin carboxyl carrier protein [Bacteroidota bacterium]|nr:acetyl-CoA carboxylase biotin carboxyl carrier protein [Bacteroidota bacterium]
MNKKEIEELIRFVSKSGVSEVSLEQKDFKITIINAPKHAEYSYAAPQVMHAAAATPSIPIPPPVAVSYAAAPPEKTNDESKYHVVKSPMIGTFYRTPNPDKPNFVNVGDEVKQGQVICIIEAMKLFNEIESDISGRIVKVLVDNSTPVEYDQPLFLVEPA